MYEPLYLPVGLHSTPCVSVLIILHPCPERDATVILIRDRDDGIYEIYIATLEICQRNAKKAYCIRNAGKWVWVLACWRTYHVPGICCGTGHLHQFTFRSY